MANLLFSELTYYLRGVCFDIHNELRAGHQENDYENALVVALERDGIPHRRQPVFHIDYRGKQVGEYRPDLMLADNKLLLELKAQPAIQPLHKAQVLSYLRVTDAELGMILNFGAANMQFERLPNFMGRRVPAAKPDRQAPPGDQLYPELTQHIVDALYRVHFALGPGYLHQVYRRATRIELSYSNLKLTYIRQLPLRFQGTIIGTTATRLFLIDQKLTLATVALRTLHERDIERLRWATQEIGCQLGLIANFYPTRLQLVFVRCS
jgi:GxxExxY protein